MPCSDKGCSNPLCAGWSAEQIAATRRQEAFNAAHVRSALSIAHRPQFSPPCTHTHRCTRTHQVLGVPEKNVLLLDYEDSQLTSYPFAQVRRRLLCSSAAQPRASSLMRGVPGRRPMCTGQGIDDCGHQAVPAADCHELVAVPALRNEALAGLGRSGLPPRPPGTAHATHTTHTAHSALTNGCRCVVFVRTGRGQIRLGGTPHHMSKRREA